MCQVGKSIVSTANSNDNNSTNNPNTNDHLLSVIDLDSGNPVAFESYWKSLGDKCTVMISGSDFLSYTCNKNNKACWFLLPEFDNAIRRLHALVGNAVLDDDRHIVVGTGSIQLFHAAIYALASSPIDRPNPINVVAEAPYYSAYQLGTDYLKSGLYKWAGDANEFEVVKNEAFIEIVTSPNNPDGSIRESVLVKGNGLQGKGKLIHDLAYYWPHYTPITNPADHDIMLFTISKCTGHAGSRLGWAIVKDKKVALKMTEHIMISSIGVSKESQVRAAKLMEVVCNDYKQFGFNYSRNLFHYAHNLMAKRWKKLRDVIEHNDALSLFPTIQKKYCRFFRRHSETFPAFAWLKCKDEMIEDCDRFMRDELKINGRSGKEFGADAKFVRISMVCDDGEFNSLLARLAAIKSIKNPKSN